MSFTASGIAHATASGTTEAERTKSVLRAAVGGGGATFRGAAAGGVAFVAGLGKTGVAVAVEARPLLAAAGGGGLTARGAEIAGGATGAVVVGAATLLAGA